MKIVYSGLQYTNFDPALGLSFEHVNFYESLRQMKGVEVIYFPYERILELGRGRGNEELLKLVREEKPDLFFAFMFTDELLPDALEAIKKITTSVAWFSDDHWRFYNYSKKYAPHFSWVVTTYSEAVRLYREMGVRAVRSQWGINTNVCKPHSWSGNGAVPAVAFVGTYSKPRAKIISFLERNGIHVSVYGNGWRGGRISQDKMLEIFSNAKINLALNIAPGYFNKNSLGRLFFRRSVDKIVPDFHFIDNLKSWSRRGIPQIKARHFEIPGCGGFVITSPADDLENYFKPGAEMVIYGDLGDLAEKVKYYLAHDDERKEIALAGYRKAVSDHTYEKRFLNIFKEMGLKY
jgi:spore maturation protein CgeB